MQKREKDGFYVLRVIRYGIVLLLAVYTGILLASQGDSHTPFAEAEQAVTKALDVGTMNKATIRELKRRYGLNAKEFESVSYYYRQGTMEVEELLLVRVREEAQVHTVTDAAMRRKEVQLDNFRGYGAEQVKLLESSILETRGRYVLFVVSPKAQEAEKNFKKSL